MCGLYREVALRSGRPHRRVAPALSHPPPEWPPASLPRARSPSSRALPAGGLCGTRTLRLGAEDPHVPLALCALLRAVRALLAVVELPPPETLALERFALAGRGALGHVGVPGSRLSGDGPRPWRASLAKEGDEPASASGSPCARSGRSPGPCAAG